MRNFKFIFLFIITVIIFSSFITKDSTSKKEEWIFWNKDKSIQWKDFKGVSQDSKYTAVISTYILNQEYEWGAKVIQKTIAAFMNCNESWYDGKDTTALGLQHEQYHFNITELYARKMRKEWCSLGYKFSNKKELKSSWLKVYSLLYREKEERQRAYDAETSHSYNIQKQKEWEMAIDKELKELEDYTCNTYFIHLKDK